MANTFKNTVLTVTDLTVALVNTGNHIVSNISFSLREGEVLGLVGESGSGKTTLSSALLGYARHGAKIIQGTIELDDEDILSLDDHALRQVRGYKISHVAQDPGTALNPALSIGQHLFELLEVHQAQLSSAEKYQKVAKILDEVGLPHDELFLKRYPHQLSGGQQQRILLALAFLLQPRLIVLDEPTTALDVTTQTLVLNIIRKLCREYNVAAIYVSHDLTVVKDIADRVIEFMQGLLRLETRFKPLWLTEHNIPLNVFDLIKYQSEHPNFLTDLWQLANKPLFEALEGHTIKALDHDTVFGKICAKFDTYTKSGRLSQTKSRNIFNFFCALELHGSDELKKKYSKSQYYQYISDLMSCGFSKAYLQNLDSESKNNVIPFVQLVKIDFQNQVPDWYQEPESRFAKVG